MFEEKVTRKEFDLFRDAYYESRAHFLGMFKELAELGVTQSRVLREAIENLKGLTEVVNDNAEQSEMDGELLEAVVDSLEEMKTVSELLAGAVGKEIAVLPEIPARVTIQPGLPERLGLVKAPKGRKHAELPEAVEIELPQGGFLTPFGAESAD